MRGRLLQGMIVGTIAIKASVSLRPLPTGRTGFTHGTPRELRGMPLPRDWLDT
jgi:hypothetical protein